MPRLSKSAICPVPSTPMVFVITHGCASRHNACRIASAASGSFAILSRNIRAHSRSRSPGYGLHTPHSTPGCNSHPSVPRRIMVTCLLLRVLKRTPSREQLTRVASQVYPNPPRIHTVFGSGPATRTIAKTRFIPFLFNSAFAPSSPQCVSFGEQLAQRRTSMDVLQKLFEQHFHIPPQQVKPLQGQLGGSGRVITRLSAGPHTAIGHVSAIGILYPVREENVAFLEFSRHFRRHGLPVPEIYADDLAHGAYIEEDLGDVTLYDFLSAHRAGDTISPEVVEAYRKVVAI